MGVSWLQILVTSFRIWSLSELSHVLCIWCCRSPMPLEERLGLSKVMHGVFLQCLIIACFDCCCPAHSSYHRCPGAGTCLLLCLCQSLDILWLQPHHDSPSSWGSLWSPASLSLASCSHLALTAERRSASCVWAFELGCRRVKITWMVLPQLKTSLHLFFGSFCGGRLKHSCCFFKLETLHLWEWIWIRNKVIGGWE